MFLFQVTATAPVKSDAALYSAIKSKSRPEALKSIALLEKELAGKQAALDALSAVKKQVNAMNWAPAETKAAALKAEIAKANRPATAATQAGSTAFVSTATMEGAKKKFEAENWKGAAKDYKELLKGELGDDERKTAQLGLAFASYKLEKYQDAIKHYTDAIDGGKLAKNELAAAYLIRANTYDNDMVKGYDNAIKDYTSAIENGDQKWANFYRGNLYHAKEEYGKAVADYTAAIDSGKFKEDELAVLQQNRGNSYFQLGKYAEAKADYAAAQGTYSKKEDKDGCANAMVACDRALGTKQEAVPGQATETVLVQRTKITAEDLGLTDYYGKTLYDKFEDVSGYDKNALLVKVLDYAKDNVKGFGDWRNGIEGWTEDVSKMALIKSLYLISYGRGLGNMKASLDRVADVNAKDSGDILLALWNGTESQVSGAMTTTTKGTTQITAAQKKWWTGNFKELVTEEVLGDIQAKKDAATKAQAPEVSAPVENTVATTYTGKEAFLENPVVKIAQEILGEKFDATLEKYRITDEAPDKGKYSINLVLAALAEIPQQAEVPQAATDAAASVNSVAACMKGEASVKDTFVALGLLNENGELAGDARALGYVNSMKLKEGKLRRAISKGKASEDIAKILDAEMVANLAALGITKESLVAKGDAMNDDDRRILAWFNKDETLSAIKKKGMPANSANTMEERLQSVSQEIDKYFAQAAGAYAGAAAEKMAMPASSYEKLGELLMYDNSLPENSGKGLLSRIIFKEENGDVAPRTHQEANDIYSQLADAKDGEGKYTQASVAAKLDEVLKAKPADAQAIEKPEQAGVVEQPPAAAGQQAQGAIKPENITVVETTSAEAAKEVPLPATLEKNWIAQFKEAPVFVQFYNEIAKDVPGAIDKLAERLTGKNYQAPSAPAEADAVDELVRVVRQIAPNFAQSVSEELKKKIEGIGVPLN